MNDEIYFYDASALLQIPSAYFNDVVILTSVSVIKKLEEAKRQGNTRAEEYLQYFRYSGISNPDNQLVCIHNSEGPTAEIEDAKWLDNTYYPDRVVFVTADLSTALLAQTYFGSDSIKLI